MKKQTKYSVVLFFVFLFSAHFLSAQRTETLLNGKFGFTGLWIGPKYNFSYFNEDFSYVRGGLFGFEFGKTVLIGWSGTRFRDRVTVEDFEDTFKLDYSNFILYITPRSSKVIHPLLGIQLGGGDLEFDNLDTDRVFVVQPSVGLEVNVFQWFRAGVEGGYRHVTGIDTPGLETNDVSSPFAQINLKFGFSWGDEF